MKKILFLKALILSFLLINSPIFSTEDQQSTSEQTSPSSLKFRVNPLENIIDANGSNLMKNFEEAVKIEVGIFQRKKDKYIKILESYEKRLQQNTALSAAERYVIETDVMSLRRKVKTTDEKITKCIEKEGFLQQILRQILKPNDITYMSTYSVSVINWKFLSTVNVHELPQIRFSNPCESGEDSVRTIYRFPGLSGTMQEKVYALYRPDMIFPLEKIQKRIKELACFVRHSDENSSTVNLARDIEKLTIEQVALKSGQSSTDRIVQEIERLEAKVRTFIIPLFAIPYWMAEIITAFNNEVQFHQNNRKKEVSSNADNDDDE